MAMAYQALWTVHELGVRQVCAKRRDFRTQMDGTHPGVYFVPFNVPARPCVVGLEWFPLFYDITVTLYLKKSIVG